MSERGLLNALHGMQLWGIVRQSSDPSLGKSRCGSNDEFLAAYRRLEEEVTNVEEENAKLRELVRDMRACCDHECGSCQYGDLMYCRALIDARVRELGIEVE